MLARLGGWSFRNPRRVVAAWVTVGVVVFGALFAIGPGFDAAFENPRRLSESGFDALDTHFGGVGSGESGSIVFRSETSIDDPAVRTAMEALFAEVAQLEGVIVSSPYEGPGGAVQISDDGRVAFAALSLSADLDFTETSEVGAEIAALAPEAPFSRWGSRSPWPWRAWASVQPSPS